MPFGISSLIFSTLSDELRANDKDRPDYWIWILFSRSAGHFYADYDLLD